MRYGLIAGNGKFPFLVVEGARRAGAELAVAAIREETDPAIEKVADRVTWVGVGQLGKMIRFFKREGVEKAIMAGQVKHVQIFSGALPDVRMLKMLLSLPRRNTDALIGGVAAELAREGIELIDSTYFLKTICREKARSRAARPTSASAATSLTASKSRARSRGSIWVRPSSCARAPASPSRRWRARTRPSGARANSRGAASRSSRSRSPTRTCASTCPSSACRP